MFTSPDLTGGSWHVGVRTYTNCADSHGLNPTPFGMPFVCLLVRRLRLKRMGSQHSGCELKSYTIRNESVTGEDGNGRPPHKTYFSRKYYRPCLWLLLRSKSSMQPSTILFLYKNTLCKNTEAQFAQKIRTRLEHAELQMRN